jgi:hypothetical protein
MAVRTSAGTTIHVSAGIPATYDVTGYAALTYTAIGEVTNLGEFGREYNLVTHNPVATRSTVKRKGSYNEGQISLEVGLDTDDAGQILMKTASASDNDHSFKITTQNGDVYYFAAQVMSFRVSVGGVDDITSASIMLELTSNSAGVGIVESLTA